MMHLPKRSLHAIACGIVVLLFSGCSGGRTYEDYVPAVETARAALETALAAWRSDGQVGEIPHTKPVIFVSDCSRKPGQKLEQFEILGEAPGESPRCFAVRLVLANPREELTTRYIILGIDPLQVYRHEDFEMLLHWDHAMMVEKAKAEQAAAKK